jgi:hypothetical protein
MNEGMTSHDDVTKADADRTPHYGDELARIHHEHFGMVARSASRTLLHTLAQGGVRAGTVVNLASGSGILSGAVVDAGYHAIGVDISPSVVAIAFHTSAGGTSTTRASTRSSFGSGVMRMPFADAHGPRTTRGRQRTVSVVPRTAVGSPS